MYNVFKIWSVLQCHNDCSTGPCAILLGGSSLFYFKNLYTMYIEVFTKEIELFKHIPKIFGNRGGPLR